MYLINSKIFRLHALYVCDLKNLNIFRVNYCMPSTSLLK